MDRSEHDQGVDGGTAAAYAGAFLASPATADQIHAWYQNQLDHQGWSDFQVARAMHQLSAHGYSRGTRERFLVAVDDPGLMAGSSGRQVPSGDTVYEMTYMILPSS